MTKREKPSIIVRRTKRGIVPVSAFDEERLSALPLDTEFDITARTKRSNQQLRLYWSILAGVCRATDIAPDATHLSHLLEFDLGYVALVRLLDGRIVEWRDSLALHNMEPPEFNEYFEAAMKRLAEVVGFDPMQALAEAA